MGLTGLDIYKQLPKKNCGECGPPTCLAFAMALAAGKANLDACPYVTEEAKQALAAAAAPPIKLVKIGTGDGVVETGDETVMFRHEKTFFHPTGIAVRLSDSDGPDEVGKSAREIASTKIERVGQTYGIDMIAVWADSGDAGSFKEAAVAAAEACDLPLVLGSEDPTVMEAAVEEVGNGSPLLYCATPDNYEGMVGLAKEFDSPLALRAGDLDGLEGLVGEVTGMGFDELLLDPGSSGLSQRLADLTQLRRLAIKKRFRPFGYPTVVVTEREDPESEIIEACTYVAKYASVVVLRAREMHQLMPLLTWRQNVFTDPQKPIQVQAKLQEVGEVTPESPVYVTTNFSLTYFSVEGEVEASRIPAYILPVDTEGTSVLTAWAADKFTADSIAEAVKKAEIEETVKHRELVIPGHVAVLSGKLEEASGWNVVVGPREASGIPSFARERYG